MDTRGQRPGPEPGVYRIRVRGELDDRWAGSPPGLTIERVAGGDTVLFVPAADQAALHGLLRMLRDLGVALVSINPVGDGQPGKGPGEET